MRGPPSSVFPPPVNRAADENAIKRKGTAEGITRLARVTSRFYIYIYIVGRFSSVHHGCIREISPQDVYTDISFKRETHYLRWPSFFNTLSDQKELALTPTLVFNKPETRIVKLNLNCIIIQSVSLPRFLSFSPRIYKFEFPSSILSSLNNPSSTFVSSLLRS